MSAMISTIGRALPEKNNGFAMAPRMWRDIRALTKDAGEADPRKQKSLSTPDSDTGRRFEFDPCPPDNGPAGDAAFARRRTLLVRRRAFCQGPCTLGGSFGSLCRQCPRGR